MRRIRKLRLLAVVVVFGLLGLTMFTFGLVVSIRSQLPQLDPAARHPEQNGIVYASDGHSVLLVLRGSQSRTIVPDSAISPWIKYAIVAIEDKRFWEHRGLDLRGIARAAYEDIVHGHVVQGGSTITQQFVKTAWTSEQRTIGRKLKEAAFSWQLEQDPHWSKTRILDAYLNTIYFGNQAYGIEQACRAYFGHSAKHMTIGEAALLAGIPQDPSLYDPVTHPGATRTRRHEVLKAMLDQKLIDASEARRWDASPLPRPQDVRLPGTQGKAPYFANYVREQLLQVYGSRRKVFSSGLRVKTTIDLGLQKLARQSVLAELPSKDGPQAALVALDAKTGAVLAMVGGRNYHKSQFNLATQSNRQVGSAFKPFVLATALKSGIAPSSTLVSKPVTLDLGDRLWPVHNFEGEYMGPITLTTATVHSDNSVFAQLTALVGPKNVATTARALGISGKLPPYLSIGLGTLGVSPLDMARAYSAFADGGHRIDGSITGNRPRVIDCVLDARNDCEQVNRPVEHTVLTSDQAATIDQILQGVVQSGTARAAQVPGYPVAGKTGTTEDYGDAWFVGFTPRLVVAVWVGYPTKLVPMQTEFHGSPVVGGTYPALIFKDFAEKALDYLGEEPESFPQPEWLSQVPRRVALRHGTLELDNGYCKDTTALVFYSGSRPLQTADCKQNEVDVPKVVGMTLARAKARLAEMPLTPSIAYKPASPRQQVGVVLKQFPARGTLSSYDKVTLVLAKPLHGVVPKLVGLPLAKARARLRRRHLHARLAGSGSGKVVGQSPKGGVAAAPGMQVTLVAGGD